MFICALIPDTPVEITVLESEGDYIVRVPIGWDGDDERVFSLVVALGPLNGYADVSGYELTFCIMIASSVSDDEIVRLWDGLTVRPIIPEARHRALIRQMLHSAVFELISVARPGLVHMTTHTPHLPVQALDKFNEVAAIFREHGFVAGRADPWHGRHIWMMERV